MLRISTTTIFHKNTKEADPVSKIQVLSCSIVKTNLKEDANLLRQSFILVWINKFQANNLSTCWSYSYSYFYGKVLDHEILKGLNFCLWINKVGRYQN